MSSKKAKSKASKKSNGASKPEVKANPEAKSYAAKILRAYGPVTAIRATVQRFTSLERKDMLAIAKELKINPATCSTQWQLVKNDGLRIELQ